MGVAGSQVYSGPRSYASFLVDGSGTLSAWGYNADHLGLGGYYNQLTPAAVSFPSGVHGWKAVVVAEGGYGAWTFAIGDNAQLYGAGHILSGYLDSLTLIQPPAGVGGWAAVSASDQGWLAVSTNGAIYGNINGRVWWPQPPSGATRWTQVAVGSYFSSTRPDIFALDNQGRLYSTYSGTAWFPNPAFTVVPLPAGATAWTNLSPGSLFMLALANDGNLYGWGDNGAGQLAQGYQSTYTNVPQRIALPPGKVGWVAISAGKSHALATTTDGQLYAWGANAHGELGLGDNQPNRSVPTAVPNVTNVTAIAAGYAHSLAVANCQVLAWGANQNGQLGAGFASAFYPMPLASQFTYDICSTNPPTLPVVSITAPDPTASEGTWILSTLGTPVTNTGRFEIFRTVATAASLQVNVSVGGTASNGVDYLFIPASITIPANSNSVSVLVVPAGNTLAVDPATVFLSLGPDPGYQLGNSTNATITLLQNEPQPSVPPLPVLTLQLFVGTNLNGQAFTIQSSTNLIDWSVLATATNVWGVVSFTETNRAFFRQRFIRAIPLSGG